MDSSRPVASLVLYAPNVHCGGGLVLLKSLLNDLPSSTELTAILDSRAKEELLVPSTGDVFWINPTIASRIKGELLLRRTSRSHPLVFCFHGLPPVFTTHTRVVVFQQNRNYFGFNRFFEFSLRTGVRLAFERLINRLFRNRVSEYIVQTPSMKAAIIQVSRQSQFDVKVRPFVDSLPESLFQEAAAAEWDFVYVADGEAHKNHRALIEAWSLLADQGLRPSLALTLSPRDETLSNWVSEKAATHGLRVKNLGLMPRAEIFSLYQRAGALIFPSTSESFGMPLVEADRMGLPIVASELDFVRDVCEPAETFDPQSPISIARAVRRFLGKPEKSLQMLTPTQFWEALFNTSSNVPN